MALQIIVNFAVFVAAFNPGHYSQNRVTRVRQLAGLFSQGKILDVKLYTK